VTHLHLVRVGLYPGEREGCLVLDYTIGRDITNYLLVVSLNDAGLVVEVDMES
jgi:Protein of unknown function (DUF2004)